MAEGFLLDPITQNPRIWGKRNQERDSFSRRTGELIKVKRCKLSHGDVVSYKLPAVEDDGPNAHWGLIIWDAALWHVTHRMHGLLYFLKGHDGLRWTISNSWLGLVSGQKEGIRWMGEKLVQRKAWKVSTPTPTFSTKPVRWLCLPFHTGCFRGHLGRRWWLLSTDSHWGLHHRFFWPLGSVPSLHCPTLISRGQHCAGQCGLAEKSKLVRGPRGLQLQGWGFTVSWKFLRGRRGLFLLKPSEWKQSGTE